MSDAEHAEAVERAALAIAGAANADYWADAISEWEGQEQWERDAHPDNYPAGAYEDRDEFRAQARAALAAARAEARGVGEAGAAKGAPRSHERRPAIVIRTIEARRVAGERMTPERRDEQEAKIRAALDGGPVTMRGPVDRGDRVTTPSAEQIMDVLREHQTTFYGDIYTEPFGIECRCGWREATKDLPPAPVAAGREASRRHQAERVAALGLAVTAGQVRATARHSHALHDLPDPEYATRQVLAALGVTVREDEGGEGRG